MNQFLREQRLYNNRLGKPFATADECAHALMGIQSQLHYYALISLFNRTKNLNIKKITRSKNLIKSWGQRSTHHLYHQHDYTMINSIFNTRLWPLNYLKEHGIDPDYVLTTLRTYCESHEVFTKEDLIHLFPESMRPTLNVWSALMIAGCTQNFMYVEVMEDNTKRYRSALHIEKSTQDMQYMLKQYFTYYGPASIQDFAHWSGLAQRDFMTDFEAIKDEFFCSEGIYYSTQKPRKRNLKYPIMLGKFDPLLVSYKDKAWIIGDHDTSMIWRKAAHVEGVIIDETGLIATWHYNAKPNDMTYVIKPLTNLNTDILYEKAHAITTFMGREFTHFEIETPYY